MRVLALDPYLGGSHTAFFDGLTARSRHQWTLLGLPPVKSNLRIRQATIGLAEEVTRRLQAGEAWDVIFCSDMLNLAEFRGLTPEPIRSLPTIAYFFENQLTCPVRHETERDQHFVLSNLTTALTADRVWFNSRFHHEDFLVGLPVFLESLSEGRLTNMVERIREKSSVWYPGIETFAPRGPRPPGPMRILWVARWEHDKNPETFFQALQSLKWYGAEFRLSVIGQPFLEHPPAFDWAREYFYYHIDWWGYQPNRRDYEDALAEADIVVSTADYEFFGLSTVEAIAAGAYPVVPDRLAFPEILGAADSTEAGDFFYHGGAEELAERLVLLSQRTRKNDLWQGDPDRACRAVSKFHWDSLALPLDDELEAVARTKKR
jgi:glycosyltransferase involved in cell wall biosynthesis